MATARALLSRVRRLEQSRSPWSPFVLAHGSLAAFADAVRAEVAGGLLDGRDMLGEDGEGGVLRAVLGWHRGGAWGR